MYNRVNDFRVRCLRYILKIDHAYYSRISNEEVLNKLQLVLNKAEGLDITWEQFQVDKVLAKKKFKTAQLIGDIIFDSQITMMGHILRRDCEDQESYSRRPLTQTLQGVQTSRITQNNWTEDTLARIHYRFRQDDSVYDNHDNDQNLTIACLAVNRDF